MDAVRVAKLKSVLSGLVKEGQHAVATPAIIVRSDSRGRKKDKLTPEAVEAYQKLQETPADIWSGRSGPGASLRSTAIGGAVGSGLGFTMGGLTAGGHKVPLLAGKKKIEGLAEQAAKLKPAEKELGRLLRSQKVRRLAAIGALTGAASSYLYHQRRKELEKKLEEELGGKKQGSLLLMAGNLQAKHAMCGETHSTPKKKKTPAVEAPKPKEKKAFLIGGEQIVVGGRDDVHE